METKNLICAMMNYAMANDWCDNDVISELESIGVTHDDFISAGYGEFVEQYYS